MAGKKKRKGSWKTLAGSVAATLVMVAAAFVLLDDMTAEVAFSRIGTPLFRLMGFIAIGLVAGQVIEATGWTRHMAFLARPLFRFAGLGDRCSAAFISAFVSGVTANAMLKNFLEDGSITPRQLFLANFMNQFPAYFLHLPTTFFIVVPLTGKAGVAYFGLTFSALMIRMVILSVAGHMMFDGEQEGEVKAEGQLPEGKRLVAIRDGIRKRFPSRMINIATWVMPIYVAVFLVHRLGAFDFLNRAFAFMAISHILPVESLSVVVLGFTAEFSSGFAAAGALLDAGVLTVKQTAVALLVGNIVAFPIRAIRHQLPRYAGIFSPKLGTKILLGGQFFRIFSLIIAGTLYWIFFPG